LAAKAASDIRQMSTLTLIDLRIDAAVATFFQQVWKSWTLRAAAIKFNGRHLSNVLEHLERLAPEEKDEAWAQIERTFNSALDLFLSSHVVPLYFLQF
jgi:hypothetical protein